MKDILETIFIVIFLLIVISPWFSLWCLSDISKISDSINKLANEVKELRRAVEKLKNNNGQKGMQCEQEERRGIF